MPPDEQALPFSHDGLGIDLGLLDGRKVVGIHGKKAGAVVPVVLHADHELDAVRLPRQAGDDVGRHLQDGPGVDLEQVGRLVARYGNVVGAGIFQRGLHVVHGQHGRLAQHAGLTVFFQSGDAGQEIVRAVGIQGGIGKAPGTGSPGRGEDAAGRSAPGTAAACPVLAVSTGTRPVDAEITGEIAVDIHDGRMDLHKLHRLVQIGDDLGIIAHAVFGIGHHNGIDPGVSDDAGPGSRPGLILPVLGDCRRSLGRIRRGVHGDQPLAPQTALRRRLHRHL